MVRERRGGGGREGVGKKSKLKMYTEHACTTPKNTQSQYRDSSPLALCLFYLIVKCKMDAEKGRGGKKREGQMSESSCGKE